MEEALTLLVELILVLPFLRQMKKILTILVLVFISSCDDVINQPESNKYGTMKLTFNKPSEELTDNINNNRSQSQFVDLDAVRITINNSSPVSVSIVGGSASYSKSGISVGNATIKVELTGGGITKYTQTKTVTIIADQTTSASFNAFAITNQSINFTTSTQSTYDSGDVINFNWTNSHAGQPVDIERWDQVGGAWVKTKIIENDFIGTSFSWDTQGEASGENVKIRIQSTISNSFVDSQPFQLLSTEAIVVYNPSEPVAFHDVDSLNSFIVAAGSYGTNNQPLLVSYNTSGSLQNAVTTSSVSTDNGYTHVVIAEGFIFAVSTSSSSGRIYLDKYDGGLNFLERSTYNTSNPLAFGLAAYEYNGSTHLAIPIAYDDATYEYNASMLSFDISGSSVAYVSNWGWHTITDDQFAIDVNSRDGDIILTKIYDYTNNPYIYYQLWKNFNPTAGSTNTQNSQVDITARKTELSFIETDNHLYFNSSAQPSGFNPVTDLAAYMTTTIRYSFITNISQIVDGELSEFYMSSIFLNDENIEQVILGDGYTGSNFPPAIHNYIATGLQNKRIFTEFGKNGYFVRGKRIENDSYVAVGLLYDSNVKDDAILYISNASNKTSGLLEFSDIVTDQFPQTEQIFTGKMFNAK